MANFNRLRTTVLGTAGAAAALTLAFSGGWTESPSHTDPDCTLSDINDCANTMPDPEYTELPDDRNTIVVNLGAATLAELVRQ